MTDPLVSVVMPVHNEERYVLGAIRSVLDQTYRHLELVVVDDCSTDDTQTIVSNVDDPRLVVIRPDAKFTDLGSALNAGIAVARGSLIARMDGDDLSYPHRLQTQVSFLHENPHVVLVGSWANEIDATGEFVAVSRTPMDDVAITLQLNYRNPLHHPSVVMRRETLDTVGGYDPAMQHAEDYELFRRLGEHGSLHSLPEALIEKRSHPISVSVANQDRQDEVATVISRRAASSRLSRDYPDDLFVALRWRRFASRREVSHAADLLLDLYRGMRSEAAFSRPDRAKRLTEEMIVALLSLSRAQTPEGRCRSVRWRTFEVSPLRAGTDVLDTIRRRLVKGPR